MPGLKAPLPLQTGRTSRSLITLKAKRQSLSSRSDPLPLFHRADRLPDAWFHSVTSWDGGQWSMKDSNLQPAAYEAAALTFGRMLLEKRRAVAPRRSADLFSRDVRHRYARSAGPTREAGFEPAQRVFLPLLMSSQRTNHFRHSRMLHLFTYTCAVLISSIPLLPLPFSVSHPSREA